MDVIDGLKRGVAGVLAVGAFRVLGGGLQKFQVVFQNIFYSEKNVAESGSPHQRSECSAVVGDRGSHGLHKIIDLVQPSGNDGFAQGLEALHVQRDIVVEQENSFSAVIV